VHFFLNVLIVEDNTAQIGFEPTETVALCLALVDHRQNGVLDLVDDCILLFLLLPWSNLAQTYDAYCAEHQKQDRWKWFGSLSENWENHCASTPNTEDQF